MTVRRLENNEKKVYVKKNDPNGEKYTYETEFMVDGLPCIFVRDSKNKRHGYEKFDFRDNFREI